MSKRVSLVVLGLFSLFFVAPIFAQVGQSGQISTPVGNFQGVGGGNSSINLHELNRALSCLSGKLGDMSRAAASGADLVERANFIGIGWWKLRSDAAADLKQCVNANVYRQLEMDPKGKEVATALRLLTTGFPLRTDFGAPNADVKGAARQKLLDIIQKAKISVDQLRGAKFDTTMDDKYKGDSSYAVLSWRDRINCLRIMTRYGVDLCAVRNVCVTKPCVRNACIVKHQGTGFAINPSVNNHFQEALAQLAPYLKKVVSEGKRSVAAELLPENNAHLMGKVIVEGENNEKKFRKAIKKLGRKVVPTAVVAAEREIKELVRWVPDAGRYLQAERMYDSPIATAFGLGSGMGSSSANSGIGGASNQGSNVTVPTKPILSLLNTEAPNPVSSSGIGGSNFANPGKTSTFDIISSIIGGQGCGNGCNCGCGKCTGQPNCCCCDKCQHCDKNKCGCGKCTGKPNCCCCDDCKHCDKNKCDCGCSNCTGKPGCKCCANCNCGNNGCNCGCGKCTGKPGCCCCDKCKHCDKNNVNALCTQLTKLGLSSSTVDAVRRLYSSNIIAGDNITVIDKSKNTITIIKGIGTD